MISPQNREGGSCSWVGRRRSPEPGAQELLCGMTAEPTVTVVEVNGMDAGIVDDDEVIIWSGQGEWANAFCCGPMPMAELYS